MSDPLAFILADAGDDFGKIIFGIIVFVVWGIGALVKMSKGSSEQARRRQEQLDAAIRAQVEAARQREAAAAALGQQRSGQRMPPPPVMYQQQQPRPQQQRQQQQQQQQRRQARPPALPPALRQPAQAPRQQSKKQQKRRGAPQQQQRQQPVFADEALLEEVPRVLDSEIGHGTVAASPSRRQAAALSGMKLTPESIRQQFILAEILQRPLALRDEPGR